MNQKEKFEMTAKKDENIKLFHHTTYQNILYQERMLTEYTFIYQRKSILDYD